MEGQRLIVADDFIVDGVPNLPLPENGICLADVLELPPVDARDVVAYTQPGSVRSSSRGLSW